MLKAVARFFELSRQEPSFRNLLTVERTQKALHRERSLADMLRVPISAVVFTAADPESERRTMPFLIKRLQARLRITDEIGWLSEHELCALLFAAPAAGAWTVVDAILGKFTPDVPHPLCTVYTYPYHAPAWPRGSVRSGPATKAESRQGQTHALELLLGRHVPAGLASRGAGSGPRKPVAERARQVASLLR